MNHETDDRELKEVIRIIKDNGSDRPTGHNEVKRLIARIRALEKLKIATWEHSCFRPRILNVDQVCDVCRAWWSTSDCCVKTYEPKTDGDEGNTQ